MRLFSNRGIWVSFGLLVLLSSCISTGKISIQVSVPPKRAIPAEIQSVVLMNRSMTPEFSVLNQDSLENLFIRKKLNLDIVLLDSLAADTTLQAIGQAMYESGRFDVVVPLRRNLPYNNLSGRNQSPSLSLKQVRQICNEFKTDALLLLENFTEKINTSYRSESGFSDGVPVKQFTAFVQVAYHSNWKLYQPLEKLLVAKFEVKDTIFWEKNGFSLQETYEKLPTIKEALIEGAIENGQNLASYFSPSWKQDERMYYLTNNQEADKAVFHLKKNEWKEAQEIWMKFSASNSATFRSRIEYNLALASEMNGDLKEAIVWATKSFHSKYSKPAEDYIRLLNSYIDNK
ncbi:MAG: DUF6340 family protein [Prolixibacteraceae bacterium]